MRPLLALALLSLLLGSTSFSQEPASPSRKVRPPSAEMPSKKTLQQALNRAVQFLLQTQNPDGSWGLPTRTKNLNIYAPIPGSHHAFRTATTALCMVGLTDTSSGNPEVARALLRAENWMIQHLPRLRRATPAAIYNIWGHAYAIQALVRIHRGGAQGERKETLEKLIRLQIDLLTRYESVDGGWGYYDFEIGAQKPGSSSTSFATATILVALHEAESIGIDSPPKLIRRAIASLHRQQKPDFSYIYGEYLKHYPVAPINRPGGSLARSQACNVALRLWGDPRITDGVIETWLDRLFARNGWLAIGRKRPVPHETWFSVSGYFYHYGHYYARICIEMLPAEKQGAYWAHQSQVLLALQEKDGSFWDYPLYNYHQQYGTGYTLMSLAPALKHAR